MINFHLISIFPETVKAYLNESILKRAIEKKIISVSFYNPKDFAKVSRNPELKEPIDDRPFGGGPGMVLKAEPFLEALEEAIKNSSGRREIIYFSPRGEKFNTEMAKKIASSVKENTSKNRIISFLKKGHFGKNSLDLILVSGRYEGIDSRLQEVYPGKEVSVGDYVLTGGEIPAMILIDSISRQIPGVLGNLDSLEEERISSGKYYTRPEVLNWKGKKYEVPKVLLSGNHKKIEEWKREN